MGRPRGWDAPLPIGVYWRAALVIFFNYGVDTGTVWEFMPAHEPILWRHVSWERNTPYREAKERSPAGLACLNRRVKTGKPSIGHEPGVHSHLRDIMPADPHPADPVFLAGRPAELPVPIALFARRHQAKAGHRDRSGGPWELKDLRKTGDYHDETCPSRRWKSWAIRSAGSPIATTPTGAPRIPGNHDAAAADGVPGVGEGSGGCPAADGDTPMPVEAGDDTEARRKIGYGVRPTGPRRHGETMPSRDCSRPRREAYAVPNASLQACRSPPRSAPGRPGSVP